MQNAKRKKCVPSTRFGRRLWTHPFSSVDVNILKIVLVCCWAGWVAHARNNVYLGHIQVSNVCIWYRYSVSSSSSSTLLLSSSWYRVVSKRSPSCRSLTIMKLSLCPTHARIDFDWNRLRMQRQQHLVMRCCMWLFIILPFQPAEIVFIWSVRKRVIMQKLFTLIPILMTTNETDSCVCVMCVFESFSFCRKYWIFSVRNGWPRALHTNPPISIDIVWAKKFNLLFWWKMSGTHFTSRAFGYDVMCDVMCRFESFDLPNKRLNQDVRSVDGKH